MSFACSVGSLIAVFISPKVDARKQLWDTRELGNLSLLIVLEIFWMPNQNLWFTVKNSRFASVSLEKSSAFVYLQP
jgi:hypothetical protein